MATAPTYAPTDEQRQALEHFTVGDHLVIEAGAGTGKTSTLVLMAESDRLRRGQYVAFNRSIVNEAGTKMPDSCRTSTAHSLAMRAVGHEFAPRLRSKRQPAAKVARFLGLAPLRIKVGDIPEYLAPGFLAGLTNRAISNFCNSADPMPLREHIPYVEGIDLPDGGARTWRNNDLVRDAIAPALGKAWHDLNRPTGNLRYTHDVYLKQWELNAPRIDADYIMFDEAQDASPVMLSIVQQQVEHGVQLVFVGDSQQQIYGWRGAVNALASIPDADRTFLTQSFRFGPAIADVANGCLDKVGAELRVKGYDRLVSRVLPIDQPRAILTRTNAESVGTFITALADGRTPYLVGEGKELIAFARAVEQLKAEGWTSHPELACFTSWGQVQDYVAQDPQGSELAPMVRLVETFNTGDIIKALANPLPEKDCDLVISTAHKAKGREWPSVQLAGDFPEPTPERPMTDEEWRLLYVAVTRAELALDIEAVGMLNGPQPARVPVVVPDHL